MAEKPILFSGEMVRAILDGRKTQTRRVIKPQPIGVGPIHGAPIWKGKQYKIRYEVGDLLWVRETWGVYSGFDRYAPRYIPKNPENGTVVFYAEADLNFDGKWRPSIHMPRWASRLTLRVTNVRVERVQEIEPGDCVAEGIYNAGSLASNTMYREAFAALWDSINAKRGFSWDSNPWVLVVEFKMV